MKRDVETTLIPRPSARIDSRATSKGVTWVAVPDDEGSGRSVTWHATRDSVRLDGMSAVVAPDQISTRCQGEFSRHRLTRTSQLLPEIYANDRFCAGCVHPDLQVPAGWTLETMQRQDDHVLLSSPSPLRYMATIDFHARGIRTGCSVTGRLIGEEWNKKRKKYGGRGWKQHLVDDAVVHLRELLR